MSSFFANKILLVGGRGVGFFNEAGGNSEPTIILFWPSHEIVDFIFLDFLNLIM